MKTKTRLLASTSPFTLRPASVKQLRSVFDNTRAASEGWSLFNDGELQRLDHGPIDDKDNQSGEPSFANDTEAYGFVSLRAAQGSQYHKDALAIVAPEWLDKLIVQGQI